MYKQVLVIRTDLDLSKGKTAAQAAHAAVDAALKSDKKVLEAWLDEGQKKVVLKAGLKELSDIGKKCRKLKIHFSLIKDAGLTELKPGTVTCLGIGPDKESKIDKVTGKLKLL